MTDPMLFRTRDLEKDMRCQHLAVPGVFVTDDEVLAAAEDFRKDGDDTEAQRLTWMVKMRQSFPKLIALALNTETMECFAIWADPASK